MYEKWIKSTYYSILTYDLNNNNHDLRQMSLNIIRYSTLLSSVNWNLIYVFVKKHL